MSTSQSKLEALRDRLQQLDPNEHEQLFRIVHKFTKDYTCSDTNVFVSSAGLSAECIEEMEAYVRFCFDQRVHLDADTAERMKYTRLAKTD
jgi:hypothetical protein